MARVFSLLVSFRQDVSKFYDFTGKMFVFRAIYRCNSKPDSQRFLSEFIFMSDMGS